MASELGFGRRAGDAGVPRLIVARGAAIGIRRCRDFLLSKDLDAAEKASRAIEKKLGMLESMPDIGRPARGRPGLRELPIPFGKTGYVALYRHDVAIDAGLVLALRHQREAGY